MPRTFSYPYTSPPSLYFSLFFFVNMDGTTTPPLSSDSRTVLQQVGGKSMSRYGAKYGLCLDTLMYRGVIDVMEEGRLGRVKKGKSRGWVLAGFPSVEPLLIKGRLLSSCRILKLLVFPLPSSISDSSIILFTYLSISYTPPPQPGLCCFVVLRLTFLSLTPVTRL